MKPKNSNPNNDEWVVVAEYQVDVDADLAVSLLEGNGVPCMRFPKAGQVAPHWGLFAPARVLVPPDRAEEARELLDE